VTDVDLTELCHRSGSPSLTCIRQPQASGAVSRAGGGSIYGLAGAVWGIATRGPGFKEIRRRLSNTFAAELQRHRAPEI
jgi:hypothetical protein